MLATLVDTPFDDQRWERPWKPNRQIAETNGCTNARRFGAILTELGNLCLRKTAWWAWEDSNLRPNDY